MNVTGNISSNGSVCSAATWQCTSLAWPWFIEDFRYDNLNRLVADSLSITDYRNISYSYFWLDPKVPKSQGCIKISCFLQLGFHARYKPRKRTIRRMLLYRLQLSPLEHHNGNPHFENQRNLYEASPLAHESTRMFYLRGGLKVWRAEQACAVGASNFLDSLFLSHQGERKIKAGPHAVTSLSSTTGTLLPTTSQAVDYTAFNKASHISQGSLDYFTTYGPDRLRTKTSLISGVTDDVLLTKYYALGDFEKETDADGTRELHYIAGGDGLAAIYVKYDTGPDSLFYIMQDHLGSIVGAINSESDHVYRQSFDAWGRERNPQDWSYNNIPDDFPFLRGYTGHEHLKWFGLINMNGRLYDPALCRFLSPDPYVQMPDNSQNFNRYSYCLNNPLIYTDPSGEFFIGTIFTGVVEYIKAAGQTVWDFGETIFVDGGLEFWHGGSGDAWAGFNTEFNNSWAKFDPTNPGTRFNNAVKIDVGGFKTDPNRTFAGRGLQLFSRWTWELPQTMLGKGFSHSSNIFGAVDGVDYFGGATFVTRTNQDSRWGVSLGNYINLSIRDDIVGDFDDRVINDPLFMHEYGHTFDSQRFGISYLLAIGIPSLISASSASHVDGEPYGVTTHDFRWYEMRANRNAATYFSKYYGVDWSIYETMYPRRKR